MENEQDWRLCGQERYLKGKTLVKRRYRAPRPSWDHDHCEFCWATFMEQAWPGTLQEGYTTEDEYYWVCPQCFVDFREKFQWKIKDD